jgi:threonine/homoserine/homoserine lactone efflux protein
MKWPALVIILLFVIFVIPSLRTGKISHFFAETWFGFVLIIGGVFFLLDSFKFGHMILWRGGRFGGAALDRWQLGFLGLLFLGFGIRWIYGPLRRRLKK